jgi:hypothetical protein
MNDFIWFLIGLAVLAGIVVGIYRWKTGKLPSQVDRDGDNKLF